MLALIYKYITKQSFVEFFAGKDILLNVLEFTAVHYGATIDGQRVHVARLDIVHDQERIYKYVKYTESWMDCLLQRRVMLERAIFDYFGEEPEEFDEWLMKDSEHHIKDGKIVFSI